MAYRYATALIFAVLAFALFMVVSRPENVKAGIESRLFAAPAGEVGSLSYSVAMTTVIITPPQTTPSPAAAPTPTPLPPTPLPPSPTPASAESGSRSGSPVFLIFLVVIFGGFIVALAFATLRSRLRR